MELRQLRYFVAVAEERSISRAAERLWIAQPGLSTQVRRLENELGIQLLSRHSRGVDLTAAGELFLDRARATLTAAEEARATGANLEAGVIGTVRLGIGTEAPARLTPALLAAFSDDRPDVEVTVSESFSGTILRDLRDGRLDAVLAPSASGSADLRSLRLDPEPLVVLASAGHPLGRPGPILAEELDGQRIVITGHRDGAGHDRAVADILDGLGVAADLHRGGPGPALYSAVAAGDAVALTTAAAARGNDVLVRPLEPPRSVRHALLWRAETPAPALAELIRTAEAGIATAHPALALVA
jgi:DNA-binding transcriptional LysR family regulator